jgi:hypothetical protein
MIFEVESSAWLHFSRPKFKDGEILEMQKAAINPLDLKTCNIQNKLCLKTRKMAFLFRTNTVISSSHNT